VDRHQDYSLNYVGRSFATKRLFFTQYWMVVSPHPVPNTSSTRSTSIQHYLKPICRNTVASDRERERASERQRMVIVPEIQTLAPHTQAHIGVCGPSRMRKPPQLSLSPTLHCNPSTAATYSNTEGSPAHNTEPDEILKQQRLLREAIQ